MSNNRNLTLTPRVNKHGDVVKRWVKDAGDGSNRGSAIPAPSVWNTQPRAEESLRAKLDEVLDRREYSKGNSRAEDDYIVSIVSDREGDNSTMMRVFLLNAEGSDNSMNNVRNVYTALQKEGYNDPSQYMQPENVALWHRLFKTLLPRSGKKITLSGRPDPNAFEIGPLCTYAVISPPDKQPLIEHLLVERQVHDLSQLKDMVETTDVAPALVDGVL